MRPVVVTAVLLLVVLMSMSASAAWNPGQMCRTKYHPTNYCRKDLGRGWIQYGWNRCVKAFSAPYVVYEIAKKICKNFSNGDLVSIHSVKELELVECAMYRVTTGKLHYWIGLYWTGSGFGYTDGSKHDYSNWANSQPDNSWVNPQRCIEMNYWSWGLWNDERCYIENPFVCQAKI